MADKSASLYVRMNPKTKAKAEKILSELGVAPSTVVNMMYKQIILQKGIPFEVKLPKNPTDISDMTESDLAKQIHERYIHTKKEDYIPADQLVADFKANNKNKK